jgi:hypothetical protein
MGQIIAKAQKTVLLVTDSLLVQSSGGTTNRVTADNILSAPQVQDATINGLTVGKGGGGVLYNTAFGISALAVNLTASLITASGYAALVNHTTGDGNVAYGFSAGRYWGSGTSNLTESSRSIFLGTQTKASANGNINEIVIGCNAVGNGSNSVTLGNDSITKTILQGNVGIGTTSPNANAILDVASTTKAFMPPRMTTVQRDAIASPGAGMVIYNTTTNVLNFHNGSIWGAV